MLFNIKKIPKKIVISGLILLFLIGGVLLFFQSKSAKVEEEVHFHAGFLVFVDGKRQDFSDSKYMHIEPCTDESAPHMPLNKIEEQQEKAHLHDGIGDVIHVHRKNTVWGDLFRNIGFVFPEGNLTAYLNGKPLADVLSYNILPYESLIIISGDPKGIDLESYVTYEHIQEVEQISENCGV